MRLFMRSPVSARFSVPVLHLWHKENDRSNLLQNQQRLDAALAATHIRAQLGLDQYQVAEVVEQTDSTQR